MMLTIKELIEIQDLLLELNGYVNYDPGNVLGTEVDIAFSKLQAQIKYLEQHDSK